MQRKSQFANQREECPKRHAIKLKDSIKIWHAHLASGLNCFIEPQPPQVITIALQDIWCQITPPLLLGRVYLARCPKVHRWVIAISLDEQIQECCWVLPHWDILFGITQM